MNGGSQRGIVITRIPESASSRNRLEEEIRAGFLSSPKRIPSKYFYDERGSRLFDRITRLPEYYLTRAETEILERRAVEIIELSRPEELVELGAGFSRKTRLLVAAMLGAGTGHRYLPLDVSEESLVDGAERLRELFPELDVHVVVGDFTKHLSAVPRSGRQLVCFLGSTVGNLRPRQRARFYNALRARLRPDDRLLIGYDLVKDRRTLEAAYNDARGVTAEFNRNILEVLNREFGADFEPAAFEHVARYDPERRWIASSLRATRAMSVNLRAVGLEVTIEAGERIETEVSAKFDGPAVVRELAEAGLEAVWMRTDAENRFMLALVGPGREAPAEER